MKKPTRYACWYEDPALLEAYKTKHPEDYAAGEIDPIAIWRERDFDDLDKAKAFALSDGIGEVVERLHMREDEEAPGLWDYDEKTITVEVPSVEQG